MELDIIAHPSDLRGSQVHAQQVEAAGFGAIWWTDSGRSAYLAATASALGTERIQIGTGIAVAFPRSPMVTAGIAWELAASTGGRFVLGLGSQVKAHIERRYSTDFNPPGPRMKEYVESIKAIFRAFQGEEKLAYEGEYYRFSLLPPMWSPGPIEVPAPKIYISAVRPYMSRLVGEVGDGIHVHPFHSPDYVKAVQRTAIEEGLARSGRKLEEITFAVPVMTAVGDSDEERERTREHARTMIAFYGSTPGYEAMFEHHGYEGMGQELNALQRRGDIAGMKALVSDEVMAHYAVESTWNDLADALVARYRDLAPSVRVISYTAADHWSDPAMREKWSQVAQAMRSAG
ncbi:MAG: TIGR03617 family F420-dependent LLM class oxidoreductase [Deltaproteobacteria bacterium]|jgi:probable F420-dependent oxidoreductase|nr:TIGR03617 family F420-dependent LLM class oxidoreductase [Deltaproteobacteria bacterium]MBW2497417.1 TIGR03617 family F420-dependent LLM class oxidoreductase [Deltaproteobacteria bacterium]